VLRFRGDEYLSGFDTLLPDSLPDTPAGGAAGEPVVRAADRRGLRTDFADLYLGVGVALFEAGDRRRAIACFRRALDFRPGDPAATGNLELLGVAGG
jgi:hypothetical protein